MHGRIELDSHADKIVLGSNFTPIQYSGRKCDVSPYTDDYEAIKSVPIANAGTAWTSKDTIDTYILIFHEGFWMRDQMEHSLLNPNQLRNFGVTVQDNPFADAPLYISTVNGYFVLPLEIL